MIRCWRHLPRSARRETARREQRPPGPKSLKIKQFRARPHEGQVRVRQFPRKDLQPSFALLEGAMFLNCSRLTRQSRTRLWKTRDLFSRGQKRPLYEGPHLDREVWRRLTLLK